MIPKAMIFPVVIGITAAHVKEHPAHSLEKVFMIGGDATRRDEPVGVSQIMSMESAGQSEHVGAQTGSWLTIETLNKQVMAGALRRMIRN